MNRTIHSLLFAFVAVALVACGDDPSGPSGPVRDAGIDAIPDAPEDTGLEDTGVADTGIDIVEDTTPDVTPDTCWTIFEAVGPNEVTVGRGGRNDLAVRVTTCNGPAADVAIEYIVSGPAEGSMMRVRRARTDADGIARGVLVAGNLETQFIVDAEMDGQDAVRFEVTIEGLALGAIDATSVWDGEEALTSFTASVFDGVACDAIDPFEPTGALEIADPVSSTSQVVTFADLTPGDAFAVTVQGYTGATSDVLTAFGCVDGLVVEGDVTTEVEVRLNALPVVFSGVYELDNRFDLADVLPPSVATTLRTLDELTDDTDIDGDRATENYGLDPAAFLLDFVYREFCCWEAVDADPATPGFQADFDSCRAQSFTHPTGDLEQLYTQDFTSWDGAQPTFFGMCGQLEFGTNELLQTEVQTMIEDNVPDVALRLATMIGDLSRAVTDMHIVSELTVGEVYVDKLGSFTHRLDRMIVDLHDLEGELTVYEFDLADAGFENLEYTDETTVSEGDRLEIPEHSFRLDFGRLVAFVFTDVLLPTLDCDRDHDGTTEPCGSTADLLGTWIDCGEIAVLLEDNIGILGESTYRSFCNVGIDAAGARVEASLRDAFEAETVITLEGSCFAGELDARFVAETLVDGEWDGELLEDGTSFGAFAGTFDGVRAD